MKKITLFFAIFLILIAISSFSWASTEITVDFSVLDSNLGTKDFYSEFQHYFPSLTDSDLQSLTNCFIYIGDKTVSSYLVYAIFYDSPISIYYYEASTSYLKFRNNGTGHFYIFSLRSYQNLAVNSPPSSRYF